MKKTFKTLLALLLALTLVCALFIPVFADDASGGDDEPEETQAPADPTDAEPTDGEEEEGEDECDPEIECNECDAQEIGVAAPGDPVKPADDSCKDCFNLTFEAELAFIKDYSKYYKLGTLTMGECALVKVYILNEDGTLYASKIDIKEHHNRVVDILWNGLDMNGTHPAGSWNNPTAVRFTLTVIATDIDGFDHYWGTWFTYKYYDNDRPAKADAAPAANGAADGKANGDVPHTGL